MLLSRCFFAGPGGVLVTNGVDNLSVILSYPVHEHE